MGSVINAKVFVMLKNIKITSIYNLILFVIFLNGMKSQSCDDLGDLRQVLVCEDCEEQTLEVCLFSASTMGEFTWENVCFENSWNILNVDVYCRQNGYDRAREGFIPSGTDLEYGGNSRKVNHVVCDGTENKLTNCSYVFSNIRCTLPLYYPDTDCVDLEHETEETSPPVTATGTSSSVANDDSEFEFTTPPLTNAGIISDSVILILLTSISGGLLISITLAALLACIIIFFKKIYRMNTIVRAVSDNHMTPRVNIESAPHFTTSTFNLAPPTPIYSPGLHQQSERTFDSSSYELPELVYLPEPIYDDVIVVNQDAILYESSSQHSNSSMEIVYDNLVEGEVSDPALYLQFSKNNNNMIDFMESMETDDTEHLYDNQHTNFYIEPPTNLPQLESVFNHCFNEIERRDIEMGNEFASGQFGVVYRAVYHTEKGDIPVAIKTLKEAANSDMKVAFMREAAILAQFQHPNVLRMIGVLTTQQPYMMVTELLKTELEDLLRNMKTGGLHLKESLPVLLLKFSQEISAGMEHLSEKHFIHRDLAARNVLVAKDLSCRIADFGMSRELNSDSEYYTSSGGRIPLRWTAPEAVFYQKYSEKSDVWSFGMTLFEIWSLGDKPWGSDATNEVIVEGLSVGRKLSPPTGCPRDVYSIMVDTWRMDPSSRPTFSHIHSKLTNISSPDASSLPTDPSHSLGNDPILSKDLFLDLQQII